MSHDFHESVHHDTIVMNKLQTFFFCGPATQRGSWPPNSWGFFLDHTQQRTTVGRTPLDEWSIRRRDLYLTTHNTHNRQTSMPLVVFEPTISAGKRPQTYASDHAATGTGWLLGCKSYNLVASYCCFGGAYCLHLQSNRVPEDMHGRFPQNDNCLPDHII